MIERIDRQRGDVPEVGLSEELLKVNLKDWTKKDDYRELYTRFDHCGFPRNCWLGKADRVDRSSFLFSLDLFLIPLELALLGCSHFYKRWYTNQSQ
jgi:hypothetical protein